MTRHLSIAALFAILALPLPAAATGFTDVGDDIRRHVDWSAELHGLLRTRGSLIYNWDLDCGPTPSGDPLFPVPLSDPSSQFLTHADFRLRSDIAVYAPGGFAAVKVRLDTLDNLTLGSMPRGTPSASLDQRSPDAPIKVERAYGEVLTPVGLLAFGRMGNQFGLGVLANGGDCRDCDAGDSADRIAFITPIGGLTWAAAYDFTSSGPFVPRRAPNRYIDLDPSDNVRSVTVAVLDWKTDLSRNRRSRAGRITGEWGAYFAYRWQDRDVPVGYVATADAVPLTPSQSVYRGFRGYAGSLWGRLTLPSGRIEAEAAVLGAHIDQATLIPGALLRNPVDSFQYGGALESDFYFANEDLHFGFDGGLASGDPAPGFGAIQNPNSPAPQPGDLDGPQANPARGDNRVDNFRFSPSYRIDKILFREIIGTVTDAFYFRPHASYRLWRHSHGELDLAVAAIASFAMQPTSTPGGERPLGVEVDPSLAYLHEDGFHALIEYAALFPMSGLSNPTLGLSAKPAQLIRLRLGLAY